MTRNLFVGVLSLASLGALPAADAALIGRLPDGIGSYQAYYDDDLNLTWLAASNYAAIELSDDRVQEIISAVGSIDGYTLKESDFVGYGMGNYSGLMNWWGAMAWVSELTFAGLSDWHLPGADSCGGFGCTLSDMGHLYSIEGGDSASLRIKFPDLQDDIYWTSYVNTDDTITTFRFTDGLQAYDTKLNTHYVWAVHSGDIAAIPLPAPVWLLTSGLLGMIGIARRRH